MLSVGCFGSGRCSVCRYSRYSTWSLRGQAPHNSQVGGLGGMAAATPIGNAGEIWGDAVPIVRSYILRRNRFGSVFVSVRLVWHLNPIISNTTCYYNIFCSRTPPVCLDLAHGEGPGPSGTAHLAFAQCMTLWNVSKYYRQLCIVLRR